jgi:hypothetical protein
MAAIAAERIVHDLEQAAATPQACQKAKVGAIFRRAVTRECRSISQVGERCSGNSGNARS